MPEYDPQTGSPPAALKNRLLQYHMEMDFQAVPPCSTGLSGGSGNPWRIRNNHVHPRSQPQRSGYPADTPVSAFRKRIMVLLPFPQRSFLVRYRFRNNRLHSPDSLQEYLTIPSAQESVLPCQNLTQPFSSLLLHQLIGFLVSLPTPAAFLPEGRRPHWLPIHQSLRPQTVPSAPVPGCC